MYVKKSDWKCYKTGKEPILLTNKEYKDLCFYKDMRNQSVALRSVAKIIV